MKIVFLGGDARMLFAFDILKNCFEAESIGLFKGDCGSLEKADVILLPVPATRDKTFVNCPLTDKKIPLFDIKLLKGEPLILTAGYDFSRVRQIDYTKLDDFCIRNAVPTAEGAIAAAINETDFTLFDSDILITGFGRVGKVLASRLKPLCKSVTVSARKQSDFSLLEAMALKRINTAEVKDRINDFDIVFNTLDLPLFDELSPFKSVYLFDLSTKGCLDYGNAEGLRIKKLPAIPGKTAPKTAGRIIAETVKDIIRREF